MEDILPLGSIVKLKNNKTFVIIGYISYKNNEDGAYDYICCLPHVGIKREKIDLKLDVDFFYINKYEIDKVLFIGYSDEDFEKYKLVLSFYTNEKEKIKGYTGNIDEVCGEDLVGFFETNFTIENDKEDVNNE